MERYLTIRVPKRLLKAILVVTIVGAVIAPIAVSASHTFTDVTDANVFHDQITWLADAGVTKGCNPPTNDMFCPGANVTREQMAAFMKRLAEAKVVDAATAVNADHATTADSATTAGDAGTLDGRDSADFVGTTDFIKVFAAATFEIGGAIRSSAGPVTGATNLSPGEYRVNFSENFRPGDVAPIVSVTRLNTSGGSCAWSFNGSSDTEIDVSCHTPTGASTNALFSMVVYTVDQGLSLASTEWHPSSGR
jgi:hypothetical protein